MKHIDWKNIFSKVWPHAVAVAAMILLSCIYFAPIVVENKQLPQGDVISASGMGHDSKIYHDKTDRYAHWSNGMFGGMPHNYSYSIPSKSLFRPIGKIIKFGFDPYTIGIVFLYLLGFYVFMLCLGCSSWLSLLGAIAFALASYNIIIIDAGHVNKCLVIATIAPIIGGVMLCYRKRYIIGVIVTILSLGLNVYWNHQQISYYLIIMLLCLAVAYFIHALRTKEVKDFFVASAILIASAVLSILPAADKLIPTMDYQKETMRGGAVLKTDGDIKAEKSGLNRDYAFMWSYGKAETMTLLIPNYYGASNNYPIGKNSETYRLVKKYAGAGTAKQFAQNAPMYWGDQPFTSGPVYAGAIICFLFLLGLLVVEDKDRWWLLAAAVIGIILSWGRNCPEINNFLFDYLPLYNKFRTPSMALVITTTAMAILGMMALKKVVDKEVQPKHLYIAAGVTGFICLLFAIAPSLAGNFSAASDAQWPEWLQNAFVIDRKMMLRQDAWRSLIFIALSFGVMWAYLRFPKMKQPVLLAIIGVLVLADLWVVDKRFLNDNHFVPKKQQLLSPTAADQQILQDTDPDYRVLNQASNTFNESRTSYYHKSIGGYSPAKLRRYQDVIDYYLSGRLNMNVINMLNTRYVITQEGVQRNPAAMGNAWFVNTIQWVNNPNEEIKAIGDADLWKIAVIDTCWQSKVQSTSFTNDQASIVLFEYKAPDDLVYESNNSAAGLAVFSEVYYKTWKAYVDGEEVPVLRANYILRAIEVPAGRHTIEFKCRDELLIKTQGWSIMASLLVGLVLLGLIGLAIYKKRKS